MKLKRSDEWRRSHINLLIKPSVYTPQAQIEKYQMACYHSLVKEDSSEKVWHLITQKHQGLYITKEIMLCMFDVPKAMLANILGVSETFLKKHKEILSGNRWNFGKMPKNMQLELVKKRDYFIEEMFKRGNYTVSMILSEAQVYSEKNCLKKKEIQQKMKKDEISIIQPPMDCEIVEDQPCVELDWGPIDDLFE